MLFQKKLTITLGLLEILTIWPLTLFQDYKLCSNNIFFLFPVLPKVSPASRSLASVWKVVLAAFQMDGSFL